MAASIATTPSSADAFRDLVQNTTVTAFSGPEDIINDAQKHNSYWTRFETSGAPLSKMMQSTPKIYEAIYLNSKRKAKTYSADSDRHSWQSDDVLDNWEVTWRYMVTHYKWTEQEIEFQTAGSSDRATKIADIKKAKEMNAKTDLVDFMEDLAWAVPDKDAMESADGTEPYSVLAFVNEYTNGLHAPTGGTAWTTVQGIDPTVKTNWKPYAGTYAENPTAGWDLFPALSRACHSTKWDAMPHFPEMGTPTKAAGEVLATNLSGVVNFEDGLRLNQDQPVGGYSSQDPDFPGPKFRGRPVIYISALDTAAAFPTGTSGAADTMDTTTGNKGGPRYFGIKNEYMRCIWHSARYMHKLDTRRPDGGSIATWIQPFDSWMNRVCRSRMRHFVVGPSANLS